MFYTIFTLPHFTSLKLIRERRIASKRTNNICGICNSRQGRITVGKWDRDRMLTGRCWEFARQHKTCTQIIYNKYAKLYVCVCVHTLRKKGWIQASSRIKQGEKEAAAATCRKSKTPDDKLSWEQQNKWKLKTHDGGPMAGHAFVMCPSRVRRLVCVLRLIVGPLALLRSSRNNP